MKVIITMVELQCVSTSNPACNIGAYPSWCGLRGWYVSNDLNVSRQQYDTVYNDDGDDYRCWTHRGQTKRHE